MKILTISALIATSVVTSLALVSHQAMAAQDWQQRRVLSPTMHERTRERAGRIIIYDGLHETVVDEALDTQFDRIGSMMFVNVERTSADGEISEDDDCD